MKKRWPLIASILIGLAWIGVLFFYLSTYEERPAYVIQASQEPALAHPVYAQFVYTQLIEAQDIHRVNKVVLPMFIPTAGQQFTVRLLRNDKAVQEWTVRPQQEGVQDIELVLDKPSLIDGSLGVQVDGGTISHDAKTSAPRLFIETADGSFEHGHYRIAQNEKKGDISLQVYEEKTRWRLFTEAVSGQDRFKTLGRAGMWLALALVTLHAPFALRKVDAQQ